MLREDVSVSAADLLAVSATDGSITEEGLRNDIDVGIRYIQAWLDGNGAAGIHGLMEDAATAEIARGQVWQWLRHGKVGLDTVHTVLDELHPDGGAARELFERVALSEHFAEFLTLPAYEVLT